MTLRILAVDDSPTIRSLIDQTLAQAGIETHFAWDGMQGLEMLNSLQPNVVITDINMPRLDGIEFIKAVRKMDRHCSLPILVLTTDSSPQQKQRAREVGATGWIIKPFDPEKLIRSIQKVTGYEVPE